MPPPDHYRTLGVLPSAEPVVVAAAYRALAQRYHPDKWAGDPAVAHDRMSEINEAYRVLSDPHLRADYDASYRNADHADYQSEEREDYDSAFADALSGLEQRWSVAVEVLPDLATTRASLAKTSTSLAFTFVTFMLESKLFNRRDEVAKNLEGAFLERYFGANQIILSYAKELIAEGRRDAARTLNKYVDVLGSGIEPELVIDKVEKQYGIRAERVRRGKLEGLVKAVVSNGYFDDATQLARQLGYTVEERGGGLFFNSRFEIIVQSSRGSVRRFKEPVAFIKWVQSDLCRQ